MTTADLSEDIGEQPSRLHNKYRDHAKWGKWMTQYIGHRRGEWWWKGAVDDD